MAKAYVILADGFEDIEALAPIDILRRGGVVVETISISGTREVVSSHGVKVLADNIFMTAGNFADADLLVLPGGMPGTENINYHDGIKRILQWQNRQGKLIGAICAAPVILGGLGLLQGKRVTCYPNNARMLNDVIYTGEPVTVDGNIITANGPGAAMAFGYQLLSNFVDKEKVEALKQGMVYKG